MMIAYYTTSSSIILHRIQLLFHNRCYDRQRLFCRFLTQWKQGESYYDTILVVGTITKKRRNFPVLLSLPLSSSSIPTYIRWNSLWKANYTNVIFHNHPNNNNTTKTTNNGRLVSTSTTTTTTTTTRRNDWNYKNQRNKKTNHWIKTLESKTQALIKTKDNNSNNREKMEQAIHDCILEWSQLWSRRDHNYRQELLQGFHKRQMNELQKDTANIQRGAKMTDQLIHILLDWKEQTLSTQQQQQQQQQQNNNVVRKQQTSLETLCNVVMNGWAKSFSPDDTSGRRAQAIFDRMEYLYKKSNYTSQDICPTSFTFASVIDAWSKSNSNDSTKRANDMLKRLEAFIELQQQSSSSTTNHNNSFLISQNKEQLLICYNSVMNAHVQKSYKHADELKAAENLLKRLEDPNFFLSPDVYTYSTLLNGYALCARRQKDTPIKSERLLQRILNQYEQTNKTKKRTNNHIRPNNVTFGSVISCYVHSGTKDGAENAERILEWMITLSLGKYPDLKPSNLNFGSIMNAYSKKRSVYGAKSAQRLIDRMFYLYESENLDHFKPNYQSFVICMDAWAKSRSPDAAVHAEKILLRMEELFLNDTEAVKTINNYGYNLVIDAWSKSRQKGSAKKAESVLKRMNEVYEITNNASVLPDKISYTAVMKAWINGREKGFEQKAATLLSEMEQMYFNGNEKVKPDTISYANVIDGFAKAGKPNLAEIVLKRMEDLYLSSPDGNNSIRNEDVKPNVTCYNILINAYGKSKTEGSLEKCEEILKRMETSPNHDLRPNQVSYTTYLDALAQSNDAENKVEKAEKILSRMIKRYQVDRQKDVQPTAQTWNTIIFIYAKTLDLPKKAERAVEVFQRMKNFGSKPDVVTYNSLLNACSFVPDEEKEISLRIALTLFESLYQTKKLKTYNDAQSDGTVQADVITYKSILNICRELIDDVNEREKVISDVFLKCREEGMVSETIIATLRISVSNSLFWNLMEKEEYADGEHIKITDLPTEWRRNVF